MNVRPPLRTGRQTTSSPNFRRFCLFPVRFFRCIIKVQQGTKFNLSHQACWRFILKYIFSSRYEHLQGNLVIFLSLQSHSASASQEINGFPARPRSPTPSPIRSMVQWGNCPCLWLKLAMQTLLPSHSNARRNKLYSKAVFSSFLHRQQTPFRARFGGGWGGGP